MAGRQLRLDLRIRFAIGDDSPSIFREARSLVGGEPFRPETQVPLHRGDQVVK